jgi:hypothetical protein
MQFRDSRPLLGLAGRLCGALLRGRRCANASGHQGNVPAAKLLAEIIGQPRAHSCSPSFATCAPSRSR